MQIKTQSAALLALALFQPLAGRLAQITHRGRSIEQRSDAVGGPMTPAKGAFAIWGPLFAGSIALAVRWFFHRSCAAPENGRIAWLSGAAFAGNSAWSMQAQFAGLGAASLGILSASTAAAVAAAIAAESAAGHSQYARFATVPTGALAGWLTVASFANLEATLNTLRSRPPEAAASQRAVRLVGAASTAAAVLAMSTRGNWGYAGAAAWGLGGIGLRNHRESRPAVVRAAVIGVVAVGLTTILARRLLRCGR